MDGAVDQRRQPQQPRQMRKIDGDLPERGMRNPGNARRRERHHRMIHLLQEQAMQIDEIARHMQRGELAPAAGQHLVAAASPLTTSEQAFGRAPSFTMSWPAWKSTSCDAA